MLAVGNLILVKAAYGAVLLASVSSAQTSAKPPVAEKDACRARVSAALGRIKADEVRPEDVQTIVAAKAVDAIPALERQFERATFPDIRARLAIALVKLGDKDGAAWEYLLKNATAVVESDPPYPLSDLGPPAGEKKDFSPEFKEWAKKQKMDENEAVVYAGLAQEAILELGATGDPRAIPVLRRALGCRNPIVQASAAKSLAKLGDQEAAPQILAACKRGPQQSARLIAVALVYFDSAEARSGVDLYLSKEEARRVRNDRARGVGPFGEGPDSAGDQACTTK